MKRILSLTCIAILLSACSSRPRSRASQSSRPPCGHAGDSPNRSEYVRYDAQPELVSMDEPVYPEVAKGRALEGAVFVQVLVGRDGHVKETGITEGIPRRSKEGQVTKMVPVSDGRWVKDIGGVPEIREAAVAGSMPNRIR